MDRITGLQDLQDKQNQTLSTVLKNLDRMAGWFSWSLTGGCLDRMAGFGVWEEYLAGYPFNGNVFMDISDFAEKNVTFRIQTRYDGDHDGGICLAGIFVANCDHYCNSFGCNCGFKDGVHCTHCSSCVALALACNANRDHACWSSNEKGCDYYTPLKLFNKIDLNGDGAIVFFEAKSHFLVRNISIDDIKLKAHFSAMDINKDAIINPHEFDEDLKSASSKILLEINSIKSLINYKR